jgi:hypothetical protein
MELIALHTWRGKNIKKARFIWNLIKLMCKWKDGILDLSWYINFGLEICQKQFYQILSIRMPLLASLLTKSRICLHTANLTVITFRENTMDSLRSLERWDREFESYSRHGCLCVRLFCVCVVLCVGSGLWTGLSLVQGVPPSVQKKKEKRKLKKTPGPNKWL